MLEIALRYVASITCIEAQHINEESLSSPPWSRAQIRSTQLMPLKLQHSTVALDFPSHACVKILLETEGVCQNGHIGKITRGKCVLE